MRRSLRFFIVQNLCRVLVRFQSVETASTRLANLSLVPINEILHTSLDWQDRLWTASLERVVEDHVKKNVSAESVLVLPRLGGGVGDTMTVLNYGMIMARELQKNVCYVAPAVHPHTCYAELLLRPEESALLGGDWLKSVLKHLTSKAQCVKEDSREYMKATMPLSHYLLHLLRQYGDKHNKFRYDMEDSYDPLKDPKIVNEVNPMLKEEFIAYCKQNNLLASLCRYLDLLDAKWELEVPTYPFLQNTKFDSLKKEIGITKPYIVLHIKLKQDYPERDTYYIGNPSAYKEGIEWLLELGFQVVCIGSPDEPSYKESIHITSGDLIDYHHHTTHTLENDLRLIHGCEFMIGCCSGPATLCDLFLKPLLRLNAYMFCMVEMKGYQRYYPMNLRKTHSGQLASWDELLESRLLFTKDPQKLKSDGYEIEFNSSDQILGAIKEFHKLYETKTWRVMSDAQVAYRRSIRPIHVTLNHGSSLPCDHFLAQRNSTH